MIGKKSPTTRTDSTKRRTFIPTIAFAAIAFSLGVLSDAFEVGEKVWRYFSPSEVNANCYQRWLSMGFDYFRESHPPGRFGDNPTGRQREDIIKFWRAEELVPYQKKKDAGLLQRPLKDIPDSEFVIRLLTNAEKLITKEGGDLTNNAWVTPSNFVFLEVWMSGEADVQTVEVHGVTVETHGGLLPFSMGLLRNLKSAVWSESGVKFTDIHDGDNNILLRDTTVKLNASQSFRAPSGGDYLRVPVLNFLTVSPDGEKRIECLSGTAFFPKHIELKYSDGRSNVRDIEDLADMWTIDYAFPGWRIGG